MVRECRYCEMRWKPGLVVGFVICVLLGLQVALFGYASTPWGNTDTLYPLLGQMPTPRRKSASLNPLLRNVSASWRKAATLNSSLRTVAYNNVDIFLSACYSDRKPVFLLDPSVLQKQINTPKDTKDCKCLCAKQPVTVFGIFDEFWKEEKELIQVLQQQFTVLNYSEGDPRLLSIDSPVATSKISTHYFFSRLNHTVHLILLYERKNRYWWHGALPNDPNTLAELNNVGVRWENLSLGQHAGAFDGMDLSEVILDGQQLLAVSPPEPFLKQLPDSRFIECNYTRAQHFYSLYPPDRSRKARTYRNNACELLSAGVEALEGINATHWLHGGTILGWFRQCDIFPHSMDVDLAMWNWDYQPILEHAFKAKKFFLKYIFGKVSDSFELSFIKNRIKLDIFFFYEEDDYTWNGGVKRKTGLKLKYLYPKFSLCWTEFFEHKVRVPCDPLAYVRAQYGDEWFEPIANWSWEKSPPNVRENGYWPKAERSQVIQVFWRFTDFLGL